MGPYQQEEVGWLFHHGDRKQWHMRDAQVTQWVPLGTPVLSCNRD